MNGTVEQVAVPPGLIVQDELHSGSLLKVGQFKELQENFYAITTPDRHRIERLEALLAGASDVVSTSEFGLL